jgi:uncharacterized protein YcfJ
LNVWCATFAGISNSNIGRFVRIPFTFTVVSRILISSNTYGSTMPRRNPTVFDDGHGPLSSMDEQRGGIIGALAGGVAGAYYGPGGAIAGALLGWAAGEEIDD